jgi:hypothetical protein
MLMELGKEVIFLFKIIIGTIAVTAQESGEGAQCLKQFQQH